MSKNTDLSAPFVDMRRYLQAVRELPDIRLSDDEAAAMLQAGETEKVFQTLQKLVPFVVQRHVYDAVYRENYQDMVQEGNMAAWKCLATWKPNKGMSLASWAYMYIRKAVTAEMRRDLRYLTTHEHRTFDQDIGSMVLDSDESDQGAWEDAQYAAATCRTIRKKLPKRDKLLWDMLLKGNTQQEIADKLGLSQSRVSRIVGELYRAVRVGA